VGLIVEGMLNTVVGVGSALFFGALAGCLLNIGLWVDPIRPFFGAIIASMFISFCCENERKRDRPPEFCWHSGWASFGGICVSFAIAYLVFEDQDARWNRLQGKSEQMDELVRLWTSDRSQAVMELNALARRKRADE